MGKKFNQKIQRASSITIDAAVLVMSRVQYCMNAITVKVAADFHYGFGIPIIALASGYVSPAPSRRHDGLISGAAIIGIPNHYLPFPFTSW